jgi:hypothetical protein
VADDKGVPRSAPNALTVKLPTTTLACHREPAWFRIARLGPNYYSSHPGNRFSTREIPGGVLYLGEDSTTCFWEVFWETLSSVGQELRVDRKKITERSVYAATLKRDFVVFNACNPVHLKRVGANAVGCFNGDYAVCRGWGALVYLAPEKVDGILFPSARSGGKKNLALFGGRVLPADVEFKDPGTKLLADPAIGELLITESIGWVG